MEESVAIVELAVACGLAGLKEPNPLLTSTYGVGQLIRAAAEKGFRKIVVGLGGSSTNDGGLGALQALGVEIETEGVEEVRCILTNVFISKQYLGYDSQRSGFVARQISFQGAAGFSD